MANPQVSSASVIAAGSVGSLTLSHTVPSGQSLLAILVEWGGANTISSVTWNGSAASAYITQVNTSVAANNNRRNCAIYYVLSPTARTADIVVTFSTTVNVAAISALNISDSDTSTPFRGYSTADLAGGATTAGGAVGSVSGDLIIDVLSGRYNGSQDVSQTRWTYNTGVSGFGGGTSSKVATSASTSMSWSFSATGAVGVTWIGAAVKPASGGGGGTATDLTVQGASHSLTNTALSLSKLVSLVVDSAQHTHTSSSVSLVEQLSLDIYSSTHSLSSEVLSFSSEKMLDVSNSLHGHSTTALVLSTAVALAVSNATHSHNTDSIELSSVSVLALEDVLHGQTTNSVSLDSGLAIDIQDALHSDIAQTLALSSVLALQLDSATLSHTTSTVALAAQLSLAVSDAIQSVASSSLELNSGSGLAIDSATHSQSALVADLSMAMALVVQDAIHVQVSDIPTLAASLTLAVENVLHAHEVTSLTLTWTGSVFSRERMLRIAAEVRSLLVDEDRIYRI